ncbi:hypothetical protein [Ruania zhangjianzhongii]|uniref:hypothetical protein n=1 Tax=Ruania zhangjianzhongii TaxID=2603206 RepID=UPI0011C9815B|nr:hypothetical protein [Ruania zhangjianzhongii]
MPWASVGAVLLLLSGCTGTTTVDPDPTSPPPEPQPAAVAQLPETESSLVAQTDPAALALDSSAEFFASARAVVLAPAEDQAAALRAASIGIALGAPVLLTGSQDAAIEAEIVRLGAETLIPVGSVDLDAVDVTSMNVQPAPEDTDGLAELFGTAVDGSFGDASAPEAEAVAQSIAALEPGQVYPGDSSAAVPSRSGHMPPLLHGEGIEGLHVLADGQDYQAVAVANARAAGGQVAIVSGDPRASVGAVSALGAPEAVVGYGTSFGDQDTFAWQAATAATGTELPGGGQLVFDSTRYVALYGHPGTPSLGVLGEQNTDETIDLAAERAADYADLTEDTVVPTLEVIVTVAAGSAGADGNYSTEFPAENFVELIEAAADAGQYVVLDFQPGRANFLDQVREYEELLEYPNVGIALDPEWRLAEDERPLQQIGSVRAREVNQVVNYLADFVQEHALPQKMVVLHQFQQQMIRGRDNLDLSREEVALLIHADGHGTPEAKRETWRDVRSGAPDGMHWGWKNFIDEDSPMLTPARTYRIQPQPDYVSYQ